ncbi:YolD-like family protein [Alkalibacillus almallahensis]|uniref:YolD-like family protein n=1 Tax=Alkalibacillus almallahensis TaxID=1379154 RepID=UPI001ABA0F03|nr:YolD-like family protein [Alkalibacillus almallahensis]NIK10947.1 hypothetical protein [Alkalibacillus almallahensis]
MMHHDRGSIKWTSLMLPEHVDALQDIWQVQNDQQPPMLDDQQLSYYIHVLTEAYQTGQPIHIVYYKANEFREMNGWVLDWSKQDQAVRIQTMDDEREWIPLRHIKDMTE